MAYHHTVLQQLLKLVPRLEFESLAKQFDGKRRSHALSRWSQFVSLMLGHISNRQSLRDIEAALSSQSTQHYHLGIQSVSRSSLARANEKLDPAFFQELFCRLYQLCQQMPGKPGKGFRFKGKLFSLDGSLIDLSMKVFPWADIAPKKAALKLHLGLDHDGLIPAFAAITEGLESEIDSVDLSVFPKNSVLVFDRGYCRYDWYQQLSDRGLFWVTRARANMQYDVVKDLPVKANSNLIKDQIIQLNSKTATRAKVKTTRRVEYQDPETNKHYVFLTNHKRWAAKTIADIYKSRWEIELFFKWIKQNLKIRSFLGNSFYAVATQVYVALCAYLLLAYLKFRSKSVMGIQAILRLIQLNLFQRRPINELLHKPKKKPPDPQTVFQLRFA